MLNKPLHLFFPLFTQGVGLFQHLPCLLSWKTYDTLRGGKWARADGLSRKWHANTWENGCGSPYLFLLLLIPAERLINHPLPQLSAEPAENAKINMQTSLQHPPQQPRHRHMWRQATFLRFSSCKPLLCLFSIRAALNAATGCTYQPLWAITVMSTGRCTRIIHQQRRVKSNLSDVVVLSVFLMIDSGRDKPGLQGSAREVETGW